MQIPAHELRFILCVHICLYSVANRVACNFTSLKKKTEEKQEANEERKKKRQQHGDFAFNLFADVNSFVCINKWLTLFICICVCVYVFVLMHSPVYAIGNYTKITSQRVSHSLTRSNTHTHTSASTHIRTV